MQVYISKDKPLIINIHEQKVATLQENSTILSVNLTQEHLKKD